MSGKTVDRQSVMIDGAKAAIGSRAILIRANRPGVVPMERRLPDGSRNISTAEYSAQGKMINKRMVRPLRFGQDGVQFINPNDHDDLVLLEECKLWLAQGDDPRIAERDIRIELAGENELPPITLYDKLKVDTLLERMREVVDTLADDPNAVREFLEACARYELQRTDGRGKASRQKVLDAIDDLGVDAGVEYGNDVVEEV